MQLLARGASVNDPIGLLFEAYHVLPCYNFKTYIRRHYNDYLDSKLINLTHEALTTSALCKYDWLRMKGQWGAKSPDDEKIVSMAAQINTLKGHLKADKNLEDALNDNKKTRNKENRGNKTRQKEDEAWKKIPPKDGDKKSKEMGKHTFHWCEHHMAWCMHLPSDCRLGNQRIHFLMATILRMTPWPIRRHRGPIWRRHHKVKKKVKNWNPETTTTTRHWFRANLFALATASLKVGCQAELSLRCLHQSHRFHLHAFAGIKGDSKSGQVLFDSDSFPIGIDNHASYCMANSPHLFDNLILSDVGKVDGINDGLAILDKGTFKFSISNDDGRVHQICIPSSLYLPNLQGCLLSPQHWVQEAGDNETWMGNFAHCCILHWLGGKKTVPFHTLTNTPIFHMASSSSTYRAFAATFEAMEAPFFRWETTLQLPGPRFPREYVIPE